jgi:radical SAM superfamily enzyme YgiQ (UPF0313 family)
MKILLISPERERKKEEAFLFKLSFLNLPYVAAVTPPDEVAPRAYQIAEEFKKRGIPVVMGGVHASMLPEEALQHVDAVVIGEAEEVWPELIEDFKKGQLKRVYKKNGFVNPSDLPLPRRELLNGVDGDVGAKRNND